MTQPASTAPQPADRNRLRPSQRPAASVGNVPFALVLMSAILTFIPGSRSVGLGFLTILAIPAVIVWLRARKLPDGSRVLTSSTLIVWVGAFILGAALSPSSQAAAPSPQTVPAPSSAPPTIPGPETIPASPTVPAQLMDPTQPLVQAPPHPAPATRAVPAPRVAPAPAPALINEEPALGVYYKNCAAARAAGAAPLHAGDPGYRAALDRDKDGVACE